jgi:hypothetical protein
VNLFPATVVYATASTEEPSRLPYYLIMAVILTGVTVLMKKFFSKRAEGKISAVVGANESEAPALAVRIAPAPPFPENITQLRALLGDTSPAPKITRYTVPVITADDTALTIADKKLGQIVSIPAANISSIEAQIAGMKPKGTFITRKYHSLWVTVTSNGQHVAVPFTPLTGAYDQLPESTVAALANELRQRLGVKGN